jgi:hypothetical protein
MADFLNLTETQLISFAQNFSLKLGVHEPTLASITAGDVTQAGLNSTNVALCVNTVNNIREDAQEYTNVKNAMLYGDLNTALPTEPTATAWTPFADGSIAGLIAWYRMMANRIKADSGYTDAIGQDLGIVSTPDVPGATPPVLDGEALPGYNNRVGWSRDGHQALRVRRRRGSEVDFTEIATDMNPPFMDNDAPLVAGQAEPREYQGAYVDNDAITTDWSATITVIAHS